MLNTLRVGRMTQKETAPESGFFEPKIFSIHLAPLGLRKYLKDERCFGGRYFDHCVAGFSGQTERSAVGRRC